METPVQARWNKRIGWLALPVAGFGAGVLVALGSRYVPPRDYYAALFREGFCELAAVSRAIAQGAALGSGDCDATVALEPVRSLPLPPLPDLSQSLAAWAAAGNDDGGGYPVTTAPPLQAERVAPAAASLAQIVERVIAQVRSQGLPTASVSLSLVDLTGDCCAYAAYQDEVPRYPASIVKLFWLVALYGHYDAGKLQPEVDVYPDDEELMAHYSNNGASSRIVDALTQTASGAALEAADLAEWVAARQTLNDYFLRANYPDLNIAHKTLPIPDLAMETRTGRDQQFAENAAEPDAQRSLNRNYLTTAAVARLLYEIDTGQAISPEWSDRVKQHLRHSTDPAVWQWADPNAIAGFFGENLPPDTELYTKLGFTFDDGRQEAAIIASPDGRTRFILVLFANDPAYSEDETLFPQVARAVYDQMQRRRHGSQLPTR